MHSLSLFTLFFLILSQYTVFQFCYIDIRQRVMPLLNGGVLRIEIERNLHGQPPQKYSVSPDGFISPTIISFRGNFMVNCLFTFLSSTTILQ